MLTLVLVLLSISAISFAQECKPSITTASGWAAPKTICSGQMIFEENFDTLNKTIFVPQVSLWGGGVSVIMIFEVIKM